MDAKDYEVMHTVTELERSAYRAGWKAAIDAAAQVCYSQQEVNQRYSWMSKQWEDLTEHEKKLIKGILAAAAFEIGRLQPPVDTAPRPGA